jgi:hypothetical protein
MKSKLLKNLIPTLLIFLAMATIVISTLFLNQRSKNIRIKASGPTLAFTSTKTTPLVNDTFAVNIILNTNGVDVSSTDIKINYDKSILAATGIKAVGTALPVILIAPSIDSLSATGKAVVALGCLVNQSTGPKPANGTEVLAEITFTAISPGETVISFDSSSAVAVVGQTESSNTGNTFAPLNISIQATPEKKQGGFGFIPLYWEVT